MDATREQCGLRGCGKPSARKQKYCSREHAPYGALGGEPLRYQVDRGPIVRKQRNRNMKLASAEATEVKNVEPSDTSTLPSAVLEKAKVDSMALIDQSAKRLRDLMESVPAMIDGKTNLHGITAACNCASQIHKLIRLKFDIARTYAQG